MALTPAQKMKARRERLKAAGKCLICGSASARHGRTTCEVCNATAKARVEISRGYFCPACNPHRLPAGIRMSVFRHTCNAGAGGQDVRAAKLSKA